MLKAFQDFPEAIDNTIMVAKKCLFMPVKRNPVLPNFPLKNITNIVIVFL